MKKNIVNVLIANITELIAGIIIAFVIPMVVSIDSYSQIKTYTLYISYIGVLSLGYYDGMYIKYGGKDLSVLNKEKVSREIRSFVISQLFFSAIVFVYGIASHNAIIGLMGLTIAPVNTFTCFKRLYQAVGVFEVYKKGMLIFSITNMLLNCCLVFILKCDNFILYCVTTILANVIAVSYNFALFYRKIYYINRESYIKVSFAENIKLGYLILLGNLSVNAIYSIDRWFAKLYFSNVEFAYYSFAVSMLNIIMVLIQAVALTFYNYLSRTKDKTAIYEIKMILLFLGTMASGAYFFVAVIVEKFIPQYAASLEIIKISFATYPFIIVINTIFLNWYKAEKKDVNYMKSVLFMIVLSALLDLFIVRFRRLELIAAATLISFVVWYCYCQYDNFREMCNKKEVLYIILAEGIFMFTTNINIGNFIKGVVYFGIVIVMNFIFYHKYLKQLINNMCRKA